MSTKSGRKTDGGLTMSRHVDDETLLDPSNINYALFIRLLFSEEGITESGKTATILDALTLAHGLTDEQLKQAVATNLKINPEELDVDHRDKKIAAKALKQFESINRALEKSALFLWKELKLPQTSEIAKVRVGSWPELLIVLRQTAAFQKGHGGADRHLAYCALIKGAVAALELETEYAGELETDTNYVLSMMTTQHQSNKNTPLVIPKPFGIVGGAVRGILSAITDPPCNVDFEIRDKTWESQMRKYLAKPTARAQKEARKDEIAMRFKLDGRRMGTVSRVMEFMRTHFKAEATEIANKGVIDDPNEFYSLYSTLKKQRGTRGLTIDNEDNFKSSPDFAVLQINGRLRVPGSKQERSFEIQFIDTARKPHTGTASDAVYALKKDIVIATRFMGGFEKQWLLEHAIPASMDAEFTNMSPQEILNALEREGVIFKKSGTRDKYAATDVWDYWLKVKGLIKNERMRKSVAHKVNEAKARQNLYGKKGAESLTNG